MARSTRAPVMDGTVRGTAYATRKSPLSPLQGADTIRLPQPPDGCRNLCSLPRGLGTTRVLAIFRFLLVAYLCAGFVLPEPQAETLRASTVDSVQQSSETQPPRLLAAPVHRLLAVALHEIGAEPTLGSLCRSNRFHAAGLPSQSTIVSSRRSVANRLVVAACRLGSPPHSLVTQRVRLQI